MACSSLDSGYEKRIDLTYWLGGFVYFDSDQELIWLNELQYIVRFEGYIYITITPDIHSVENQVQASS